ncbi:MAG: anion permease [Firmicutes bacterium]|nr:anion permease [Bacillota bacterium]
MLIRFIRREPVLCLSAAAALASLPAAAGMRSVLNSIDLRVLGLLWSLMIVVAGLRSCGLFEALAYRLLRLSRRSSLLLSLVLVLLPFFTSMAATNDVALITFVPFTLILLEQAGQRQAAPLLLVLQTLAANLGSMATPVGNPQNLFLYGYYQMSAAGFFRTVLPLTGLSLCLLALASCRVLPPQARLPLPPRPTPRFGWRLPLYLLLFLLSLAAVLRLLPWWAAAAAVLAATALGDRPRMRQADYGLLLTFVCFFVFSGDLAQLSAVRELLQGWMSRSALLTGLLSSQVISNVPAAVLLAPFTADWRGLLLGVDIGGLGTPVASLASLITIKFYLNWPGRRVRPFLLRFLLLNALGLVVLLAAARLLYGI